MRRMVVLSLGALLACATVASAQATPPADNPNPPARTQAGPNIVDNDGDGICDRFQERDRARAGRAGRRGYGPGDGTGRQGVGPRDGSGYGPGPGANCDGTGPKGQGRGRRGPRR